MKIVIIEDEKLAQERLEELIKEIDPNSNILAKLTSIEESVKWLLKNKPDLIMLDIQLEDGLCFKIFERIEINVPVIFTTAYDQYAIKAFKLNSIDYLLKPIRKEELSQSLQKFKNLKSAYLRDFDFVFKSIMNSEVNYKKRFLVQFGQKIKKVEIDEIAYFYAMDKNVFIKTFSDSTYPVIYSLDKLTEILDPENYFRINRKMIIRINSIKNMIPFSRSRIKIDLNPPQPKVIDALVSVDRASNFKKWLDK